MALVLGTILEEGTMVAKHQDDLIASSVVVLGIGQENVLLVVVVVVVGFHHTPGMLMQAMEIVLEGIVKETTMMTAIVVVDMVKETVVLIVGTDMAVVIDMAMIAMHKMDMERNRDMIAMVLLLGEVTAMSKGTLHIVKEATEKDQGPMIAQVMGAQLMMIAIND